MMRRMKIFLVGVKYFCERCGSCEGEEDSEAVMRRWREVENKSSVTAAIISVLTCSKYFYQPNLFTFQLKLALNTALLARAFFTSSIILLTFRVLRKL